MDYSDLDGLITGYINMEGENGILPIKEEIRQLQSLPNSSEKIIEMVYEYGARGLTIERAENMLKLFIKRFLEEL